MAHGGAIPPAAVEAAIFAGGQGRRIGGGKPLRMLAGRPLLAWAVAALAPQAERISIVARTRQEAEALILAVTPALAASHARCLVPTADRAGIEGPVAALMGAVDAMEARFLLTAAADMPFLPGDLVARLAAALGPAGIALATGERDNPALALLTREGAHRLMPARSLMGTLAPLQPGRAPLPASALFNVNTAGELGEAEAMIAAGVLTGRAKR